jgi:tetratricopeptide (TPR) repeat protein
VNNFLVSLLIACVATSQLSAAPDSVTNKTGVSVVIPVDKDLVEQEYEKLLEDEEVAQAEVDKWIRERHALDEKSDGVSSAALSERIETRLEVVRKAYEDFLRRNPSHTSARLAFASFLGDLREQEASHDQMEKARVLDPENPEPWNNLANFYGHFGPVKKSFEYYAKAIELNPLETVYYHNFATTVFLFRKDAREFYQIEEQQVFDKALGLYNQAIKLDPHNFSLATDVARTYYGIKPPRTAEALAAWEYTLKVATNQIERESVHVNLARIKLNTGRFDEARQHLSAITNELHAVIKNRLIRNLTEKESAAKATNSPPAAVSK